MKTLSQLVEEKKRYYSQMDDIIQSTSREIVLSKFGLALSDFFKDWNASSTHTKEQSDRFFEIFISCMSNPPSLGVSDFNSFPNFGETGEDTDEEDAFSLEAEEERSDYVESCDDVEEDDEVERIESMLSQIEEKFGVEASDLPDICLNLSILFGLIYPYFKLHDYVQNSKAEFSNELAKNGYTPELVDDFKASILSDGDINLLVDCLADVNADICGDRSYMSDITDISEKIKDLQKKFLAEDADKTELAKQVYQLGLALIEKGAVRIVLFLNGRDYLCDKLSEKEKEAFNSILSKPEFKPILSQWVEEYNQAIFEEEAPFSLPANYFSVFKQSPNKDEYLKGSFFDTTKDVYKFVLLINYIADRGFIENNNYTKNLLAFRLTGRMRPDGNLPKIKWTGDASHGADCLFLMKCTEAKGKFNKMREFFEADFPKKNISSIVHSAGKDFMMKLNELFPEIFELPDKYKA